MRLVMMVLLAGLVAGFTVHSPVFAADKGKMWAISEIDHLMMTREHRAGALPELRTIAESAEHNFQSIVYIAQVTTEVGYHTGLLLDIARLAAACPHECPYFNEIALLAVLCLSESNQVVDLAFLAKGAKNSWDRAELERRMKTVAANAELRSYEEARRYSAHGN